jgi:sigma-B regulation protein RsbU (phosphoserine phosphatase)
VNFPRRLALPPPAAGASPAGRFRDFLLRTWRGRILVAALAVFILDQAGAPVPELLTLLSVLVLCIFALVGLTRLSRWAVRRLMWRIRTKMIVSYLFIAVVPLVLLTIFFLLVGFLGLSMTASYMVSSHMDRAAQDLRTLAQATLADLHPDDPRLRQALEDRLSPARSLHPNLEWSLVRAGKPLVTQGSAPTALPGWLEGPGFAGVVKDDKREALRGVWIQGPNFLALDVPVDEALFSRLEANTGIVVIASDKEVRDVRARRGPNGDVQLSREEERKLEAKLGQGRGVLFFSVVDRTQWDTGKKDVMGLAIRYRPTELLRRLSPGSLDMGDVFVKGMAFVGGAFLIVYVGALIVGALLARSITRSIHALSMGTERLRRGDFATTIPIQTHDQLGELAESFNMMARGIEDLLREQAEKQRLEEELRIARQIQMSLLPQQAITHPGLRIAALCLPATEVGGDYYDLLPLADSRLGVLVADVSGKGTSAALYMAELKGLVLSLSRIYDSPARLLGEANRILAANMDPRSFVTMTYAVVDTAARTMRYARAGHNPILQLEAASGRTRVLAPAGLGLGIDPGDRFEEILEEAVAPLVSGDVFLFFTDGLTEAMNDQSELFGESRLRELLASGGGVGDGMPVAELKEHILAEIRRFVGGAPVQDDMTLVILKVV